MLWSALLFGALQATYAHADVRPNPQCKAGETHRATTTSSAEARNHGDGALRITIWYPATDAADEEPAFIGAPDNPVFVAGMVAVDAAWASGPLRPVVLMSHGFGGVARQMTWLGAALARSGYVVVAVDHPGTNGRDGVTPQGAYAMWERVGDLEAALDTVLADPALAAHIDSTRIGVAGFSLGGWTAALIAGARADFAHLDRFCASSERDSICGPQLEFPLDFSQRYKVLESDSMRALAARENVNFRDARIKAAFMIAPALGEAIDPASLKTIAIPVAVLVGSADPIAVPATNANVFAHDIPGARLTVLPHVGHYDFLSECGAAGLNVAAVYCTDGPGTVRAKTHATTIEAVTNFFDRTLR